MSSAPTAISGILEDYGPRLGMDGSSRVLADAIGTGCLMSYLKATGLSWPHLPEVTAIAVDMASLTPFMTCTSADRDWQAVKCVQFDGRTLAKTKFDTDVFTHTLLDLSNCSNIELNAAQRLELLKHVQYTLQPKGIAILALDRAEFADSDDVKSLLVDAIFERGKMRVVEKEGCWIAVVMKWDLLSA